MGRRKEHVCYKEVEKEDGKKARFYIYKRGSSEYIVTDTGYEHIKHPSSKTVDAEIWTVFHAKVIRTVTPLMEQIYNKRDSES